jgi:hypothetical protein
MNENVFGGNSLWVGRKELVLDSNSRSFPYRKSPSHPDSPMSPLNMNINSVLFMVFHLG